MRPLSPIKQKILISLLAGLAIGLTYRPDWHLKILKGAKREWQKINEKTLKEKIRELYRSKLISLKENPDKSFTMVLTKKGKTRALTYYFQNMEAKQGNWDGKWRLVIFDIPERLRAGRDALREKLKEFGFYELQKSVFVFPYECEDEVDFIVEFFELRRFVRYGILEKIDNDLHLRKIFKLV